MIENILNRLDKVTKLRKPNLWMARCPAHGDGRPSLMLSLKPYKIGVHCFAGCTSKEVMESIAMEEKDLYFESDSRSRAISSICKLERQFHHVQTILNEYNKIIGTEEWTDEARGKFLDHMRHRTNILNKIQKIKSEHKL